MKKYYLSKNYKEHNSAGNKAKIDIEDVIINLGYNNAGLPRTIHKNQLISFFYTLVSVIKSIFVLSRGDILFLQYPFKKYYAFVCKVAHWKKAKIITLIHDLGSFRRKKLTVEKEIYHLNNSDVLIVHNEKMKNWLLQYGYSRPMIYLEIFDFLSQTSPVRENTTPSRVIYKVAYAGALNFKKNKFLYSMDGIIHNWNFSLYGNGFDKNLINNKKKFFYNGFLSSDRLIESVDADFGLVWDGDSTNTCSGNFGEYLKLNNPHKTSLYIRCQLPIIIWKEAALATLVLEEKIGLCINSLDELDSILASLSPEMYSEMKQNTIRICERLSSGYYITQALRRAELML